MENEQDVLGDGIGQRPDYAYDVPASFFAENGIPRGTGVFNVANFGAIADKNIDSRAAIQKAVDAAEAAGGGIVYIPAGVYGIAPDPDGEGGVKLASNVFIKGAGMGETVLRAMDNLDQKLTGIIRSPFGEATENFGIADLTLDGNRANNPDHHIPDHDTRIDGFFCGGEPEGTITVSDGTLLRVETQNNSGYGFDPHERTQRLLIDSSVSHHNGKDGFVADYTYHSEYRNNLAYENDRHGFNITTSTYDFLLENNVARDNGGSGAVVQRGSYNIPAPHDVVIRGNEFTNNGWDGILIKMATNITIENNTIDGAGKNGVCIYGANNVVIRNNDISNVSGSLAGDFSGILLREYDDTLGVSHKLWTTIGSHVEGNVVKSIGAIMGDFGIREREGAVSGTIIRGNVVQGFVDGSLNVDFNEEGVWHRDGSGDGAIDGGLGGDILYGMDGADRLRGMEGNDYLIGGRGADYMRGGAGDDVYVVDDLLDDVSEKADMGHDKVISSITYKLDDEIEDLILTGSGASEGKGNILDNRIVGNSGANRLLGRDGNDVLAGRGGNDELLGGTGNDVLNGGDGLNILSGEAGDDKYVVSNSRDDVRELAGMGTDTVFSSVSFSLGADVENLFFRGSLVANGVGNGLDNKISGNEAANSLLGGGGSDRINGRDGTDVVNGGAGADRLWGGAGADTFAFSAVADSTGNNYDTIFDFSRADGDKILANGFKRAGFIGEGEFSGHAGEWRFAHGFLSGDSNGDGVADLRINLIGVTSLFAGDLGV